MVFVLSKKTVMDLNSTDIVFFCGTVMDVGFFFLRNVPFQTSVVFLMPNVTVVRLSNQRGQTAVMLD